VASDAIGRSAPSRSVDLICQAWRERAPTVDVWALPLSRGGRGFAAAAARITGAREEPLAVAGELATAVVVTGGTVVVEAAQAGSGRSSYPVGVLVSAAASVPDARRIVVGVGDLECLDGGLGMLQAMAGREDDPDEVDLRWLRSLRRQWRGTPLTAANSEALPLLGFHGAAVRAQESLGLDSSQSQLAENALGVFLDRTRRALPSREDLLTGKERRLDREPGTGAGGGVGFGLGLMGAALRAGADVSAELSGLDQQVAIADLVVVGEDVFDWKSLQGTVLARVGEVAARLGRPVVVLSREAHVGRRESASLGVSGVYSVIPAGRLAVDVGRTSRQEPAVDAAQAVAALATRVAGTWTPG